MNNCNCNNMMEKVKKYFKRKTVTLEFNDFKQIFVSRAKSRRLL